MAVYDTRTINPPDLPVMPLLPNVESSTYGNPFTFNSDFGYYFGTRERRMIQPMKSDSCSQHSNDQREVTEA